MMMEYPDLIDVVFKSQSVCNIQKSYAVLVWGSNEYLDFLELIDGLSYKLQCRSVCCTRQTEKCMGEGLLINDRDRTALRAISICPPHQNCVERASHLPEDCCGSCTGMLSAR